MSKHMSKKYGAVRIGITQGELSGISPEIIAKAIEAVNPDKTLELVVIASMQGVKSIKSKVKKNISVEFLTPDKKLIPANIRDNDVLSCIYYGAKLAHIGELDAIVTAPIDKNKSAKKNKKFSGHTGFLKDIFKVKSALMLMSTPSFKIGIMTEHVPLKDVPKYVTKNRIIEAARLMHEFLSKTKKSPLINILALNPHAGDSGLIGKEETKIIIPAIKELNRKGIRTMGPTPADSAFTFDTKSKYDGLLAMYHDQGMIPAKIRGLDNLVNITLGLPIVRTSPGHGVAYDIAGKGIASANSMIRAINQAIDTVLASRIK